MSARLVSLDIDLLDRRADARAVDDDKVKAIAASWGDVGQLQPIKARPKDGGRFEIMAGVHRVEAGKLLGLVEIDAIVEAVGDLFAELTMIDENLCRSDLGPADRARQTARRKAIYEEIHPETAHGATGGGHNQSRQAGDSAPRFSEDTAQASGKSERTVQRDAERGERITDDALDAVAGTALDTGAFLDELKQVEPDEQLDVVEERLGRNRARQAVGAGRVQDGDSLDYFPTPPWATRALLEDVLAPNDIDIGFDLVWEPACGEGHISGVLEEYDIQVLATDINDYSVDGRSPPGWSVVADFLEASWGGEEEPPEWIITNPPFSGRGQDRALEFALRALDLASVGVALFVRTGWAMEGLDRYERLFRDNPPTLLCPFVERVPIYEGRWEPEGSSDMAYAWLVWVKGEAQRPPFRIPPGRRVARTRPDDVARFTAHPVLSYSAAAPTAAEVAGGAPAAGNHLEMASPADDLFDQAVAIVREAGRASPSMLQRRLALGWNAAMGLIEGMEAAGIVLRADTNGTRPVASTEYTSLAQSSGPPSQAAAEGNGADATSPPASAPAGEASRGVSPASTGLPRAPITFAEATPILQARYGAEGGKALAAELGIPIGTLRTWAFKLELTSKARIVASGKAWAEGRVATGHRASEEPTDA